MSRLYFPRNDFVVVKITKNDISLAGVAIPERSSWGEEYTVYAIGPKVEGLKIGDKVMIIGSQQTGNWSFVPMEKNLIVTREENIIYTWKDANDPNNVIQ
jgi:hypothetical protein